MKKIFRFIKNQSLSQFELSLYGLNLLARLFYGALIIIHCAPILERTLKIYRFRNPEEVVWLWPLKWMELVPEKIWAVFVINFTCFLAFWICMLFPKPKLWRLVAFLLYFQSLALTFSLQSSVFHQQHSTLIASFFLIFLNLKEGGDNLSQAKNKLYIWAIHISFLGSYFLSGLWKIRSLIEFITEKSWGELVCLQRALASEYADGNLIKESPFYGKILNFLENHANLSDFLWLGAVFFQISVLLSAWFPPLLRLAGIMIILFHISTSLLMNIQFLTAQYIALIFLIGHPYRRANGGIGKK